MGEGEWKKVKQQIKLQELEGQLVLLQLLETYRKSCDSLETILPNLWSYSSDLNSNALMIEQFVGKVDGVVGGCSATNGRSGKCLCF